MALASIADVKTWTGVNVDAGDIARAQAIIEIFADVTENSGAWASGGTIGEKNWRLLGQAVAYQTAWMQVHPDVFTGVDVSQVTQDGLTATIKNENARLLAPMARRCLNRLSWRRTRGIRVRRSLETEQRESGAAFADMSPRDSAIADDDRPDWVNM